MLVCAFFDLFFRFKKSLVLTRAWGDKMVKKSFIIKAETGLHARPATLFINKSKGFKSDIKVSKGDKNADAKKFLQVLALGVVKDDEIYIEINGDDENEAMVALKQLIENNFTE